MSELSHHDRALAFYSEAFQGFLEDGDLSSFVNALELLAKAQEGRPSLLMNYVTTMRRIINDIEVSPSLIEVPTSVDEFKAPNIGVDEFKAPNIGVDEFKAPNIGVDEFQSSQHWCICVCLNHQGM